MKKYILLHSLNSLRQVILKHLAYSEVRSADAGSYRIKRNAITASAVDGWLASQGWRELTDSMDSVAGSMGIMREELSSYCRDTYGCTFASWRLKLRIEDAKHLLVERPDLTVTVVGQIVGIDDKSNFRRQFFEATGCSPKEWRERNGDKED